MNAVKKKSTVKKVAPALPPVIEIGDCCAKCKFYLPESPAQGACRRFPGSPIQTMNGIMTFFPSMLNEGWCGEFDLKVP